MISPEFILIFYYYEAQAPSSDLSAPLTLPPLLSYCYYY